MFHQNLGQEPKNEYRLLIFLQKLVVVFNMADDEKEGGGDARFTYFCQRIAAAFPKIAKDKGKLDKLLQTEEIRDFVQIFCEDGATRCLVVPDTMKLDNVIPSKIGKGKVLLFIRLSSNTLTMENISSEVSLIE
jgi:hypothetical protein